MMGLPFFAFSQNLFCILSITAKVPGKNSWVQDSVGCENNPTPVERQVLDKYSAVGVKQGFGNAIFWVLILKAVQ